MRNHIPILVKKYCNKPYCPQQAALFEKALAAKPVCKKYEGELISAISYLTKNNQTESLATL